ncbi:MAG: asparagine--tRNA ligase [Anaerolineaceae bacterium 4572_78]|nr:MAG: asparagine--tRNA ligase [Anaerolineaceae bacterium 4572_78]
MSQTVRIQNIAQHVGQTIIIKGWLYAKTGKGRLQFLQIRDGSGIVQGVMFKPNLPKEVFDAGKRLSQESSIIVTGTVKEDKRAKGIPKGYELDITDLKIVQVAEDYPITPKEHGIEFLMDNRHLWIRSRKQWAILRVRAVVMQSLRQWLHEHGYLEMSTPIFTPSVGEGTTTLFKTDYFGEPIYLAQTGQLYNEANIFSFGKVYCFGPTFRAEKSKTRRHMTEFWMLEPETAYQDLDGLMEMIEQIVSYTVAQCLERCQDELEILERDLTKLKQITLPFPRISYDEALEKLADIRNNIQDHELKKLLEIEWGSDFGSPHETELTKLYDKPVFVYGYPSQCTAFYMEPWDDRPEVSKSIDLLAPEGYGEIVGGSERISDPELLLERIRHDNLPEEAFKWYIELRKFGSVPHSGFGLGLGRTVAWICGVRHVRETNPYPRTLGRVYP